MATSLEAILCTLLFLVPGYIMTLILCKVSSIPKGKISDQVLSHISFSAISASVSFPMIINLFDPDTYLFHPIQFVISALVVIFLVPVSLGVLIAYIEKYTIVNTLLEKIKFNPKTSSSTGWDDFFHTYFFPGVFAKIFLKSGRVVYVKFGEHDIASSSEVEHADIYASELYEFNEDTMDPLARWTRVNSVTGVIIPRASIDYINIIGAEKSVHHNCKIMKEERNENERETVSAHIAESGKKE